MSYNNLLDLLRRASLLLGELNAHMLDDPADVALLAEINNALEDAA